MSANSELDYVSQGGNLRRGDGGDFPRNGPSTYGASDAAIAICGDGGSASIREIATSPGRMTGRKYLPHYLTLFVFGELLLRILGYE